MTLIKTQYNRRSFLKVTTAAGGGIVLGFSWLASCTPSGQPLTEVPEEWFDINAFIKIGDNGMVTILSPNPEIGQNVKTSMPMIVAEELDVDWNDVTVEQAGLDTQKYVRQLAGGSQSIRQGWQSLRMAGATARRMLLEAAAKKWQVPVEELSTDAGVIKHQSSGKSIGYGEIASAAASIAVPAEVELKDPKDFKIIGTRRKNVDGPKIVKGESLFGLDYDREGMLIAMIVHPPVFGMKLKSVDGVKAKAMPGIKDVITINTAPEEKQWSDTNAFTELVAVVGNSTWEVMKAKKALDIQWETETPPESS
ncbi:MAG: molybdopterin-dependent oxidoreductase, partial [Bacteroidetes bacterium]|nr:molybdopterin-dependent oxidoreductase [Bacteroidota bacterium]